MAWKDTHYVDVHNYARSGMALPAIASALGVSTNRFRTWLRNNPSLRKAYNDGLRDKLDYKLSALTLNQRVFLTAYARCGNPHRTEMATGVARSSHYKWLRDDPVYLEAFQQAQEAATDELEWEARRRAVHGVKKLKFHLGVPIMVPCDASDPDAIPVEEKGKRGEPSTIRWMKYYIEHEYSDKLLVELLRANKPEKFKISSVNISNTTNTTNTTVNIGELLEELEGSRIVDSGYIETTARKLVDKQEREVLDALEEDEDE